MEILALLLLFQLKHYYADFVIQTYMQTVKKGVWLHPCGISHSLDHIWTSMVVLLIFSLLIHPIAPVAIILVTFIEGLIHYIIDFAKVKFGVKDMTKPLFWNQFGLDQVAHQLTYIGVTAYLLL